MTGTHTLDAGIVVQHRGDATFDGAVTLHMALMVKSPAPEGGGGIELEAQGYCRQKVSFAPFSTSASSGMRRNLNAVDFGALEGWPPVRHAAFFDDSGALRYYGHLVRQPGSPDGYVRFDASAIQLRVHQRAQ